MALILGGLIYELVRDFQKFFFNDLRALDETITVYPNVRIQKCLEKYLIEIA